MMKEKSYRWEPWSNIGAKVVLVTGASSGIGRDYCLDLAKAGCRLVVAARRIDRLKSLCNEINSLILSSSSSSCMSIDEPTGPQAVAVELDVSANGSIIEKSVQKAWDAFGRIDALINNAGIRGSMRKRLVQVVLYLVLCGWRSSFDFNSRYRLERSFQNRRPKRTIRHLQNYNNY